MKARLADSLPDAVESSVDLDQLLKAVESCSDTSGQQRQLALQDLRHDWRSGAVFLLLICITWLSQPAEALKTPGSRVRRALRYVHARVAVRIYCSTHIR